MAVILGLTFVLASMPSFAFAYSFLSHKMDSQIWYSASDYFLETSREHMRQAMSEWNAYIPEYRRICYNQQTHNQSYYTGQTNGYNRIYKHPNGSVDTLATNYYYYYKNDLTLFESDIVVNSNQSWANGAVPGAYDVKSTIKHELGHTLGIGHSQYSAAIMFEALDANTVRINFHTDDLNALSAKY